MAIKPRPNLVQLSNLSEWIKIDDTSFLLFTALMVIYSSTRRKKEARHGSPHKTVWSLRWAAKPLRSMLFIPLKVSLGKTLNPCCCALTPSVKQHVNMSVRGIRNETNLWLNFAHRITEKGYESKFMTLDCPTVIYPWKMSLTRTVNPQQFTSCKFL